MSNRALSALAAVVLLAPLAGAQPADRIGLYAVVGSAAPERSLFPDATDPALVVGARLAPGLDVHLGARVETATYLLGTHLGRPAPQPGDVFYRETVDRTRAAALGVRASGDAGTLRLSLSASVALDGFQRTVISQRVPDDPAPVANDDIPREVETRSATFLHAGLSGVVAVPMAGGRIAPGLGLAGSFSGADGGPINAPPARWMPFLSVPATVRLPAAEVTLDARVGVARGAGSRTESRHWAPVVEAGVRVEI